MPSPTVNSDRLPRPAYLWMLLPFAASVLGWMLWKNGWIAVLIFHGGMASALCVHRKHWHPENLWRGGSTKLFLFAVFSMVAFGFYVVFRLDDRGPELAHFFGKRHLHGFGATLLAIYFCIANPVLEEAFWRGLYVSGHRRPTLSDLAYGSFHYFIVFDPRNPTEGVVCVLALVFMGWLWRQITYRTGGHRTAILWHGLGDVAVLLGPALVIWTS